MSERSERTNVNACAFSAAAEFIYVTGTIPSMSAACSSSQQAYTSSGSAMSAIEQPADMFGRITFCSGDERMSADSAMKWTPQNTMYSASAFSAAQRERLNESPR